MDKYIEKKIIEILNHESIKACNDAITLQAIRSGTKGYRGETLDVVLRRVLTNVFKEGLHTGYEEEGTNCYDHCEQAKKEEVSKITTRIKIILTDPDEYLRGQLMDWLNEHNNS